MDDPKRVDLLHRASVKLGALLRDDGRPLAIGDTALLGVVAAAALIAFAHVYAGPTHPSGDVDTTWASIAP
jgi:hypothetical protein